MTSARYVEIPADAMLGELRAVGAAVASKGGSCAEGVSGREIVFDIHPPDRLAFVRVYTSLATGAAAVRDCGEDAVRLVLGALVPMSSAADSRGGTITRGEKAVFRPLDKGRRIYRTAPKGSEGERVTAFLERFKEALRDSYRAALHAPTCPVCKVAPMAERSTKDKTRKFLGCVRFPECRGTRPLPPVTPEGGSR
jgi:hypothetical protein